MTVKFSVKKAGNSIFTGTFPADSPEQFKAFSKVAFDEFRLAQPGVSLFDDDVMFSFDVI